MNFSGDRGASRPSFNDGRAQPNSGGSNLFRVGDTRSSEPAGLGLFGAASSGPSASHTAGFGGFRVTSGTEGASADRSGGRGGFAGGGFGRASASQTAGFGLFGNSSGASASQPSLFGGYTGGSSGATASKGASLFAFGGNSSGASASQPSLFGGFGGHSSSTRTSQTAGFGSFTGGSNGATAFKGARPLPFGGNSSSTGASQPSFFGGFGGHSSSISASQAAGFGGFTGGSSGATASKGASPFAFGGNSSGASASQPSLFGGFGGNSSFTGASQAAGFGGFKGGSSVTAASKVGGGFGGGAAATSASKSSGFFVFGGSTSGVEASATKVAVVGDSRGPRPALGTGAAAGNMLSFGPSTTAGNKGNSEMLGLKQRLNASETKRKGLEETVEDLSEKLAIALSEIETMKAAETVMQDCIAEPVIDSVSAHLLGEEREGRKTSSISSRDFADHILQNIDDWASKNGDNASTKIARDLFIVVAGINSPKDGMQSRVRESIDSLLHALPDVRNESERTEAVVKALAVVDEEMERAARVGHEDEGSRRRHHAASRAQLLSVLLQHDQLTGLTSIRMLTAIREKVQQHIKGLKEAIKTEEEKIRRERQESGKENEFNGGAYLLGLLKMYGEMSKAALPYLVSMSDELDIDLFALTGNEWKALFEMPEMPHVHQLYVDAVATLKKCKIAIEDKNDDEESMSVRTTSGIRSIFDGKVPDGTSKHGGNEALFDCLPHYCHHVANVQCSEWCTEMRRQWKWLDEKFQAGIELESKVDEALENSDDVHYLEDLKQELRQNDLSHRNHVKALKKKIRELEAEIDSD